MPRKEGKWNIGLEYQLKIIAYAATCLSENCDVEDFEIYTNQDEVPGFDDIILKVKYKSNVKPLVILGQIKHVKKLINFRGKKHTPENYFKFIAQISNEKERNPFLKQLLQDVPDENIQYWYLSNSFFLNPTQDIVLDECMSCYIEPDITYTSIFPIKNSHCCYYKLVANDICQYSDVLDKFRFLLNQPDSHEITYCIVALNRDIFSIKTANKIINYVYEYLKTPTNKKLTKHVFETELLRLFLSSSTVLPARAFEIDLQLADIWNKIILEYDITIVDNTSSEMIPYIFGCLWQRIQDLYGYVFNWNESITNFKKIDNMIHKNKFIELTKLKKCRYWLFIPDTIDVLLIEMWKSNYLPLVLSSDVEISILNKYKHLGKNFVILDNKQEVYNQVSRLDFDVLSNAADIHNVELRSEFLKRIFISLQGREPINIYSIVNNDLDLLKELKCYHILQLIRIRRIFLAERILEETNSNIFFILDYLKSENQEDINAMQVCDNKNIIIKCKSSEVEMYTRQVKNNSTIKHYLIYNLQIDHGRLELIQGEIFNLKQYILDENGNDLYYKNNKIAPIIGKCLKKKEEYINRYLRKPIIELSFLKSEKQVICFLTGDIDTFNWSFKMCIIRGSVDHLTSEIEARLKMNENSIVAIQNHSLETLWSKFSLKKYSLLLIEVQKGIPMLLKYKNCRNISSYISYEGPKFEEKSFFRETSDGITVINGEPGIGKSTLLRFLFNLCDKSNYVLFCDLNDYRKDLRQGNQKLFENPVEFMLKKDIIAQSVHLNNQYSMNSKFFDFLNKFLQKTSELILCLDSFDEILPVCQEAVLNFIRIINKQQVRVIITSRTVASNILINSFETNPIKIQSLNIRDIKNYINKKSLGEMEFKKIPLEFLENPMYLKFLITLRQENIPPFISLTRFTLYKAIMEKQIELYYMKNDECYTFSQHKDILRKNVIGVHTLLAFVAVIGEEVLTNLGLVYEELINECVYTNKVKLGLITRFNADSPIFSHQTFAEFLIAEWLSENFAKDSARYVYKMLFQKGKVHVRRLLDDILCENLTLHKAILAEDLMLVKSLCVKNDNYLKDVDKLNRTALHLASTYCTSSRTRKENYLILETIVHHMNMKQINFNSCDSITKWSWIQYLKLNQEFFEKACIFGLTATLEIYLNHEERIIEGNDVIRTIEFGHLNTTIILLKRNIFLLPTYFYFFVTTALHLGCLNRICEIIELQNYNNKEFNLLREACRNLMPLTILSDCVKVSVHGGFTALHLACMYGNVKAVKELLNLGIDINVLDNFQNEPVYYGVIQGSVEIVSLLVTRMPILNNQKAQKHTLFKLFSELITLAPFELSFLFDLHNNVYQPILHISVKKNYMEIFKILLENGYDVNQKNQYGETALYIAVEEKNANIIKILLEYDVNFAVKNNVGDHILHAAVRKQTANIVEMLLEKSVDVNVRERGKTALHVASKNRNMDIIKTLLKYQANTNFQNRSGDTSLHVATKSNRFEIIQILLQYGAKTYLKNKAGDTALHIATKNRNVKIVELLSEYGADSNLEDANGNASLNIAVKSGNMDIVKILLKYATKKNLEENTALFIAIRSGNVDVIKVLLNNGVNMNLQDDDGDTVLHIATRNDHINIVKELLEYGINTEHENKDGDTALHVAVKNEHKEVLDMLLKHWANSIHKDMDRKTILDIATRKSNVTIVKLILDYCANNYYEDIDRGIVMHIGAQTENINIIKVLLDYGVSFYDKGDETTLDISVANGFSNLTEMLTDTIKNNPIKNENIIDINFHYRKYFNALYTACKDGDVNTLKVFLKLGIGCNLTNDDGDTPLHVAARCKREEIVKILLKNGANCNIRGGDGSTSLSIAVKNKAIDVVNALLEHGADSNREDKNGNTCLHTAARKGSFNIVQLLLKYGANINRFNKDGDSVLHAAVNNNNKSKNVIDILEILLENSACINNQGRNGNTALHIAASYGNLHLVNVLLKNGAKINMRNNNGQTPLHMSLNETKNMEVFTALIQNGAYTGFMNINGDTILHTSTRNSDSNIVRALLKTGMNLNFKNQNGNTALQIATENNDANLVNILLNNNADVNSENDKGDTALFIAVRKKSTRIITMLLENDANVKRRNKIGDTVLDIAVKTESVDTVKILLDYSTYSI